jgi:hypothetical protein
MTVQLIRYTFPDRPDWEVVNKSVPLGTKYEVVGYDRHFRIMNLLTGEIRPVQSYFLVGNDDSGWMPVDCFETIGEN